MKLAPIFFAMLPALTVFASQAEVYQVAELGMVDGYRASFAAGINNNNQSVGTASNQFNFPVDLAAVNYADTTITTNLTAAEIEEVKKGNVNARALSVLLTYLSNNSGEYTVQRFADAFPIRYDLRQQIKLRETKTPQTNYEYLLDINDNGTMLGYANAPFVKQSFTPAATETAPNPVAKQLWVPENGSVLGMVLNNGSRHVLRPIYTDYGGGISVPRAISNTGYIVGTGSVGLPLVSETSINATCNGATEPKELCYYLFTSNVNSSPFDMAGLIWTLDANGKPGPATKFSFLGDKKTGLPHTRTDYPSVVYSSTPFDVNDAGIAVGMSVYTDSDDIRYNPRNFRDEVFTANQATIFQGSELNTIFDVKEWEGSRAMAINNKNIIVGSAIKRVNFDPERFFVYDMNTQKITFPKDLFSSASVTPVAINNNNQVVGSTSAYTDGSSTLRQVGFWYDMTSDTFYDLNKLLPCNSGYTIVSAQDINDKNVIVATATKKAETRDSKGDIVRDAAGNAVMTEIPVAVQLTPVANGTPDNCTTVVEQGYERKGGSFGFGWLALLLLPFIGRRRT